MADEVAQKIIESPRLYTLSRYLQALFEDRGRQLTNEELERAIYEDIEQLATLATQQIAKAKAVDEAKGGE